LYCNQREALLLREDKNESQLGWFETSPRWGGFVTFPHEHGATFDLGFDHRKLEPLTATTYPNYPLGGEM
jgi:hypothetical protein